MLLFKLLNPEVLDTLYKVIMLKAYFQKKYAIICLITTALGLTLIRIPTVLKDPFFPGDSGIRMDQAHHIITVLGNRAWLPFLKMHIWCLYKAGCPYWMFKLIPVCYFFLALVFLGLLAYRILGKSPVDLSFSLILMISFGIQPTIMFLSVSLYQEILAIALFYILLYLGMLDLKKKWPLLVLSVLALLTRESYFIYLFTLSLINYKKIIHDKKYLFSFMGLWTLAIAWVGMYSLKIITPVAANINSKTPLDYLIKLSTLGKIMASYNIHFIASGIIIVFLGTRLFPRNSNKSTTTQNGLVGRFKIFSLISIILIYVTIFLYDSYSPAPYETPRAIIPLLMHLFIWAPILYKETRGCPRKIGFSLRLILISSILLLNYGPIKLWPNKGLARASAMNQRIVKVVNDHYKGRRIKVCIIWKNYWESLKIFIAPTLYMEREFVFEKRSHSFEKDDMIIAPASFNMTDSQFRKGGKFKINRNRYAVYYRK